MRTTSTWSSAVQVAVRGLPAEQRDLAEVAAPRQVGQHQFAPRLLFGNFHEADADQVKAVGGIALAADHLARAEAHATRPGRASDRRTPWSEVAKMGTLRRWSSSARTR